MAERPPSGDDPRARMVRATIELLAEEGPAALQVRRVAAAVGATSMAVYSRFGGMPQLVEAIIAEGFRRLEQQLTLRPETEDPVADMTHFGLWYRDAGRENPHLFDLMFGLSNPGGYRQVARPTWETDKGRGTPLDTGFKGLMSTIDRAIAAGRLDPADLERVAAQLWSFSHGVTVLELGGHFSYFDDPLTEVFAPLATNLLVGLGDDRQRAATSVSEAIARNKDLSDVAAGPAAGDHTLPK